MKFYVLWLVLVLAVQADAAKQRKKAKIPALIVFGDSIMDTGNNNNLSTFLKSNFPPYGKDFPGGLATGRFSDGKVPSDLIAEKLGLAKTLPAYLSPNLKPRNLLKGITFASGGTGYDPLTAETMVCYHILRLVTIPETKGTNIKRMVRHVRTTLQASGGIAAPSLKLRRAHRFHLRQEISALAGSSLRNERSHISFHVTGFCALCAMQRHVRTTLQASGGIAAPSLKLRSLIDRGQLWRLATSSVRHANPMHLMINCYSLNSIGPTTESLGGPTRFLAVYFTSSIASSAMSSWLNKAPSVGASGAIFGLTSWLGSCICHETQTNALTTQTLGLVSRGIDNWGHIGGLLGGTAMAWLVGRHWKFEYTTRDGWRVFVDSAPAPLLLRW
ncbi:hypothetical protein F2Q69_00008012 [Brassica cretica]|uniref:Peptidase S54 rhomboid domain-containing protein n=1 Tax=Brassica cretica TaxID=69181 RepID=A0A8S9PHR9_BRACR|nr:hypothetical protein F2Q69_00008012 [Brassica cretica]